MIDGPPLQVVTGKGGVGKSTVAAALSLALARAGRRVLALELGTPAGLSEVFGVRPTGHGEPVPAAPGVKLAYVDGEAALAEYLRLRLPMLGSMEAVFRHPVYRAFVGAGPGVRELMAIGKIRDALLGLSAGQRQWDAIVLDAGASGHALQLLRMPAATAAAFASGLAHREASRVARTLADPAWTAVHVVALPEYLPIEEAAQTIAELRRLGLPVGRLVMNRCVGRAPTSAERALAVLEQAPQLPHLSSVVRQALLQARREAADIAALEARVGLRALCLPRSLSELTGAALTAFSRHLVEPDADWARDPLPVDMPKTMGDLAARPPARPRLAEVLAHARVIVCVGTGGVGKTTLSAALGLAGALRGRRSAVLTIDPARQLARAVGLPALTAELTPVALADLERADVGGSLLVGMLDEKAAWDAFIAHHAPSDRVRRAILENPFYQHLSSAMSGSTEYLAIEQMCGLEEREDLDLIVIDTPPAGHAVDFLRAPERIGRLLDPQVTRWFARPYEALGRGAYRTLSRTLSRVLRQLERAAGVQTLGEISAFFIALDGLLGAIGSRAERARKLLASERTAFVLVAGPGERVLSEGDALMAALSGLGVSLRAVIINRTHPLPPGWAGEGDPIADAIALLQMNGLPQAAIAWTRSACEQARLLAQLEQSRLARFETAIGEQVALVEVPELAHGAQGLSALSSLLELARAATGDDRRVAGA